MAEVPGREEIFNRIREAQAKGWPTDGIGEAFFESAVVSLWLEEFDRSWKCYLCLAAYETTKELTEKVNKLKGLEEEIKEKGLWESYKMGEGELNIALAHWASGNEAEAYAHAVKAEESISKVYSQVVKTEVRELEDLQREAQRLVAEVRQLEIPLLLELDDDLKPIEDTLEEAGKLAEEGKLADATEKYKEAVGELKKLKEKAERDRKLRLAGTGVAAAVGALGLLYAYKKGKLPKLKLPKLL